LIGMPLMACEATLDESLTNFTVGECIADQSDEVKDVEVESADHVSCDTPGALRVTAVFDMSGGDDFPGIDAVDQAALQGCPEDTVTYMFPTEESWEQIDDREIVCLAEA
ncbi:MAG TPA: hypothetical protein VFO59_07755, partial [Dehalococcoidia bacterium]|nr:hypothetical protein [Dehalococcoidia bacterium]